MTIHHTITAEIGRQRREQIATSIADSRRHPARGGRRWWQRDVLHRSAPATSPAAISHTAATV